MRMQVIRYAIRNIPLWLIIFGLLAPACGKKTPPKPIMQKPPPRISDLNVGVRGAGVELSWAVPDLKENVHADRFAVMKAELAWDKRNCLECPVADQTTIATIDPAHPEPAYIRKDRFILVDTSVASSRAYRYQVAILDKKGRELSLSSPVIAKVLAPPQPPNEFIAAKEAQGILLQWKAPNKNIRGEPITEELAFHIERSSMEGPWEHISPAPIKGTSFFDPAVASDEFYSYRVASIFMFEGTPVWSEPSPVRQVKAPGALPPPPPNTIWAIPAKGALEVHWLPSEGKTRGYHVYRREDKQITRLTAEPVENPPYIDRAVKPNVIYFYAVSAVGVEPSNSEGLVSKWVEIRNVQLQ
jgi:hypothetical protein